MTIKMNIRSIRAEMLIAIMGTVMLSLTITGVLQYFSEVDSRNAHIIEKSMISLQPVISLAARNINGGNLMNLQNTGAQDIYKTNPDLLYLKLSGTSAGSPKTDYAEAIPPVPLEYIYVNAAVPENKAASYAKKLQTALVDDVKVEDDENILIVQKPLTIKNGGAVHAVFSAQQLSGIGFQVFKQLFLVFLLILSGSALIAYMVGSKLSRPIEQVIRQINEFTQSLDMRLRVNVAAHNEIGELADWFNKHIQRLEQIVGDILTMTAQVNASANDIAAAVEEQAAIATQQSASLTEITATMEELSESSSQIADNAGSVVSNSKNTLSESERCVLALNQLKSKMGEITADNSRNIAEILELDRKSKEIGKIMGIINNIADQTKMIAFNAAIEASSSGEAGKRFGVVAVEIRRLADNVMESTGEIESKIEEIQKSINRLVITSENGTKAINEGAKATELSLEELMRIVEGAESVSESAMAISFSTQQQKTASNQVLTALTEINHGLHQSSASIRQTSAATHSLTNMSDALKTTLEVFKLAKKAG